MERSKTVSSKPTPGPWEVYILADDDKTYGANAGKPIIVAADGELEVCGVVANPADAPILAAAPDLLNLLKRLTDCYTGSVVFEDSERWGMWIEAKKAIAKTKGE